MITEFIQHLQKSPEAGTAISIWRDDDLAPFNVLSSTPILLREQPSRQDRNIGAANYDLWLFSQANGTPQQSGAINTRIKALQDWLLTSRDYTGKMYAVDILGGVSGPIKDGQGRWAYSLSIQARRAFG